MKLTKPALIKAVDPYIKKRYGEIVIERDNVEKLQEVLSQTFDNIGFEVRDGARSEKLVILSLSKGGIRHLPEKLWFDPGIGFAKTAEQSWELLRHLEELAELGPLVIGHSRKSFLGYPAGADRECATAAVTMYLRMQKVLAVRVHDVRSARIMFDVAEKLAAAGE